jgi:lysine 2,3-aminomutase
MHTKKEEVLTKDNDEPPPLGNTQQLNLNLNLIYNEPPQTEPSPPLPVQAELSKWYDWKWQLRNRIRTLDELKKLFPSIKEVDGLKEASARFPMAITPYYASLIRKLDDTDPVFRMIIPQLDELVDPPFLREDPLEEDIDSPLPGLVHRYRDRALIITTTMCASYCRYCTRKRVAGQRETTLSSRNLKHICEYLSSHPEVKDVILSGGDPLTLSTEHLRQILAAVRSVKSVEIVRIGSRVPVTLPMRITDELVDMLAQFHPLYLNTHFNHPVEITPQSFEACTKLANAGIPLGNQSVLLRGVNDDPQILEALFRGLLRMRVRPYYLFQCDLVRGVEHFRTPISRGIEIMEYLRGRLSGLAIPTFVVDTPHGGGKVPVMPNYIVSTSPTHTVLRNYEGMLVSYPEPLHQTTKTKSRKADKKEGSSVWELSCGCASCITPNNCERLERRKRI